MSHVRWEFVRSLERDRYEIDSWVDGFRRGENITGVVITSVAVKPLVVLWGEIINTEVVMIFTWKTL